MRSIYYINFGTFDDGNTISTKLIILLLIYHRQNLNLLKPNVNYSGRTVPLTSKVAFYIFIQQIYVLNILNMAYTLRFFLFKMQFIL